MTLCYECSKKLRAAGQMVTRYKCQNCREEKLWGNTLTPSICMACSKELGECHRCRKKLGKKRNANRHR